MTHPPTPSGPGPTRPNSQTPTGGLSIPIAPSRMIGAVLTAAVSDCSCATCVALRKIAGDMASALLQDDAPREVSS